MKTTTLVRAALAAALIGLPVAASADGNPGTYTPNGGYQNGNGQWQQRGSQAQRNAQARRDRDRDDRNNGQYNNGQYNNGRYGNGQYGNGQYGQNGQYNNQFSGTVSSFSAFNLYLNSGQQVVLHQGTVINPTGTTLQPGMNVTVYGHANGDGTFAADQINVIGNAYGNNGNNGTSGINVGGILGTLLGGLGR